MTNKTTPAIRRISKQRKIAAHHEGGHAVTALAFRVPVWSASISPRKATFGRVITPRLPAKHVDIKLYITLAGPLAHRRFAPRSNWLTGDFNVACDMICKGRAWPAKKEKYFALMSDRAEQIVEYFCPDIKVVAKALLKHETLTGDEISAVIRAARRKSRRRRRIGDPPEFALSRH